MPTVDQLAEFLERFAPRSLAESWDNVGLLIGDRSRAVSRVMTCLTVTPTTTREAIERGAKLIVSHHPVLYRPVQRLTADDPPGRMLLELIRAGVAVYSPHTAFDSTAGGINDQIAGRLGLVSSLPLRPAAGPAKSKLVVFVPDGDLERVSRAMFDAGAGVIGEYRECSFRVAGRGTFFGSEQSHPTLGQPGRREQVDEWRLEVVCPTALVQGVLAAMRAAHSYEEPAYDVYPLAVEPGRTGAGRYGDLPTATTLEAFARTVKAVFSSHLVQIVGPRDRPIRRVAVGCGSGSEFLSNAVAGGCDVLVTGEAGFHRLLEAEASGLALLLAGHFATERFAVETLAQRLCDEFPDAEIWASENEREPSWILTDR